MVCLHTLVGNKLCVKFIVYLKCVLKVCPYSTGIHIYMEREREREYLRKQGVGHAPLEFQLQLSKLWTENVYKREREREIGNNAQ